MRLTWQRNRRTLLHPFETARGRRDHQETILVTLDHQGLTGHGEACAMALYGHTLETIETALAAIALRLANRDPFHIEHILDDLLADFDAQRAAVAAVDMALHDWIGKRLNIPTTQWLGLDPSRAPLTDITIGIDDPATIAQKVREAIAFPAFKVKVGVPHELEILGAIRREAPTHEIRVDANCGWTSDDAEPRLRAVIEAVGWVIDPPSVATGKRSLRNTLADEVPPRTDAGVARTTGGSMAHPTGLSLVEQPVAADDHATLKRLRDLCLVPIIADESCVRPTDVPRLAGVVDGINIKLNKCGGIREARKMIHLARTLGLKIMLGCTSESAVGVAAAAQLAPLADWIDLDTHLLARDQPFTGLGGQAGRLTIGAAPGLGIRPAAANDPN